MDRDGLSEASLPSMNIPHTLEVVRVRRELKVHDVAIVTQTIEIQRPKCAEKLKAEKYVQI